MTLSKATIAVLCVTLPVPPLQAHHSFAAEYDAAKPIQLSGSVTKVEWTNPHVFFYVEVKDASRKTVTYAVEGGAPNVLRRMRWGKDSIRVGDVITVSGFRAKNGSNFVNGITFLLPDGTRVAVGSSYYEEDPRRGSAK
jgi:hypothetical protein